ncbi:hypothetical protein P152DRAFT_183180 [Eremomyces bilateralis CBS 781.70]|uniref:Uncharacterized protein n=1 Tax=Eremomyces bilateralis CBS 781.70 TaxID=1392243 RepID=A0A6G1GBP5_9PEZI|nr:uncharacterized protein P152DRAFT_183180 [Eremomyces bilateralis CBS 781.70]KAF1815366.1 hypothetical protein P152DRAFT_183180 [Eremomyces bilateralis CBS 781.70]
MGSLECRQCRSKVTHGVAALWERSPRTVKIYCDGTWMAAALAESTDFTGFPYLQVLPLLNRVYQDEGLSAYIYQSGGVDGPWETAKIEWISCFKWQLVSGDLVSLLLRSVLWVSAVASSIDVGIGSSRCLLKELGISCWNAGVLDQVWSSCSSHGCQVLS